MTVKKKRCSLYFCFKRHIVCV